VFEDLLQAWDGEEAVIRYDADSGAWMFVCIHSTALGPGGGGTRLRVYETPSDGLADAMRLSGAMTRKFAAADIPRGGAKAVLAVPELPEGDARRQLLLRYGELVESLGGTYRTAGDMNISPSDLDVIAERCQWVYGTTGRGGNSARGTAVGTHHAIRATVEHVFGSPDVRGMRILVQGAGSVGGDLVRLLQADGAHVLVSDVDESRAAATGASVVRAEDVIGTECELYAPCAVGGTLNAETIPRLRCRSVAGCANNQLGEPEDGDRLHEAGILYAPDYVANAGGVIQLVGLEDLAWSEDELMAGLARIGDTLRTLFRSAAEQGITPAAAAEKLTAERVAVAQVQSGR
jgi:leucine dehydrogenase